MDAIRNLIKSAINKDATQFEDDFEQAIAPKLDAALSAKYDEMFGAPVAEADDVEEVEESYDDHMEKASDHQIQADHHRELAKDAASSGIHDAGAHHRIAADLHKTAAKKYEKAADSGNTMHAATAKTAGKKAMQAAQKAKSMYESRK